jgi:site-specific DNA recombinase
MAPSQRSFLVDAAIYARLSKNRRGLSDNVEIQVAEGRAYADDKGWQTVFVGRDDDISASKFSTKPRPDYERLVTAVEAGEIEVIICTEMPRLYRRLEELLELIRMAPRTRLRAIWTTDDMGYNLSTPEGIHAAVAAVNNAMLESAKLSKRIKRKKAAHARQGMTSGGPRPYGYEGPIRDKYGNIINQERIGVEFVPAEVAILVEAKDRYLTGETIRDIVRDYYRRGLRGTAGQPWRVENFQRLLFHKRYVICGQHIEGVCADDCELPHGIRVHNGAEYPAVWPGIFTREEWDRMDARCRARAQRWPGRGRQVGRKYLLTGLVFCGQCGAYMVGARRQLEDGSWQRRYRCKKYDNYGQIVGCGRIFRGADPLETWITEAVLYRFSSPEVIRALAEPEEEDRTDELVAAYQEAKDNLDQMVADYASRLLTREQFARAKGIAEGEVEAARDALAKYQSRKVPGLTFNPAKLREEWDGMGPDMQHQVIALLVEKVTCRPGHPGGHTWRGWRFDPAYVRVVWRV